MLSLERCPGPEEVEPEEVHDRRKCKSGGSARAEEVQEQRKCKSRGSARAEEVQERRECSRTELELGYVADKAKGVAGLKPE